MSVDVVVLGGAGHVGLPLSIELANAGLTVGIYDTNPDALLAINNGWMPFREDGAAKALEKAQANLITTTGASIIEETNILIIVIGTPVDEFQGPSLRVFTELIGAIRPHLHDGMLIVLRSTVYPGTTEQIIELLADEGLDVDVAFCPERIAEGHAIKELHSLPQIVGAETPEAHERADALFRHLTEDMIHVRTKEAELAKLFTNTWRYGKFALANQLFMIANAAGVDFGEVAHAIRYKYPRAADLPNPGFAAGPCLFKDAMQLSAFAADASPLIQAAMQVNEGLPGYIVGALTRRFGTLQGMRIGILGMAFKAESDDPRASLSYKLRQLLTWAGADVMASDPYVADDRLVPVAEVLAHAELVIIGAWHDVYNELDLEGLPVVNIWSGTL
jgi:UDP-N-acetyl-D-mannosaminuronic acid dehydrogenase